MSNGIERFLFELVLNFGAADCTVCVGYPKVSDGELEDDVERCLGHSDCHFHNSCLSGYNSPHT